MSDVFDYRVYWDQGRDFGRYLREEVRKNQELWEGVHRLARVPEWAERRMREAGQGLRLLAIAEDWCGDAANLVPLFARLAESVPGLELRIVKRDENPELMERHLTNGTRSIPIVIALGPADEPIAAWGPRPAELQEFVLREKGAGVRPTREIYRDARAWYARDAGETSLREFLDRIEAALAARE